MPDNSPDPKLPVLYLAGPYTNPDPVQNTHTTVQVATALMDARICYPIVPHTSLLWHAITPRPIEFWYELDLAVMGKADGVVRLPGASSGADAEVEYARTVQLPVLEIPDTITTPDTTAAAVAVWWLTMQAVQQDLSGPSQAYTTSGPEKTVPLVLMHEPVGHLKK